jgi:alkanesulfonate monooxygenase SsuD/methylene tetrahydromethanopterin reductase-like flavin-dependent oxidoreductase (luciferase family)
MRLGLALPWAARDGNGFVSESIAAAARRVERLGFDGLWYFDAIGRGFILPDPLIAVSVAATVTERIEVGTCILQLPLRRPVELAHRVLTAHLLCRGRLVLGVGAGSTRTDFDAVGVDFSERMRLFQDALAVMRRLWRGEQVGAADLTPWPAALGGPPVLIGSWNGERWIPRAAREFDGWIASGAKTSFAVLADGLRRFRAAGGLRAIVTNIAVDLTAPTTPLEDTAPFHLRCAPDAAAARLRRVVDLGFDDAVLVPSATTESSLAAVRALLPR